MSQLQPQREFTGIWIPAVIINDPELTPTDLIVYAQIASFNCCTASNQYLAELAHVSERSVQRTLRRLEVKGYVRTEVTYSKANISQRKIFAMGVENYAEQMQDGMTNCRGGVTICHGGDDKLSPNNKEDNKDINISSSIKGRFDFLKSLIALGVKEQTARDWMQVRKEKKASNTETAFRKIEQEIAKSGATAEDCIRMSAECSWAGFKAEWMHNRQQKAGTPAPKQESAYEHNRRLMRQLLGETMGGQVDEQ